MTPIGCDSSALRIVHDPAIPCDACTSAARPSLVINPRQDSAFVAAAANLLDDGERSLVAFQLGLRGRYPNAVVRARELSGEPGPVWYLFRDGHWIDGRRTDAEPRNG